MTRVPLDPADPMLRALAVPVARAAEQLPRPPERPLPVPDQALLEQVVRRLSWGGTGRRGTARIELSAGSLAGATLVVHADEGEVTLHIEGADAAAAERFAARVERRLRDKGLVLRQA